MQVFKCDGHNCKSENHELEVTNWLTIGSADGGSLFMKNQLPGNQFSIMTIIAICIFAQYLVL